MSLIIKGRVLSRSNNLSRFEYAIFEFANTAYDEVEGITRLPEALRTKMGADGAFRFEIEPSTNGDGWVGRLRLVDRSGRAYVDTRVLPASGEVDFFTLAKATDIDNVTWPEGETPVLVSDFNKPGGPLQLTDLGTIADDHIPGTFLRVDDSRLPELVLANYLTEEEYAADQLAQNSRQQVFPEAMFWEYDHGLPYCPLVECIQSDGTVLIGAVTYPVNTTKVRIDWDAPTSGTLIVR